MAVHAPARRPGVSDKEFQKAVLRCIDAYCDMDVPRRDWEQRFPSAVKSAARHAMTLEQLRSRG